MSPRWPALLASRWFFVFLAIYVFGWTAEVFGATNVLAMTAAAGVVVALLAVGFILIERASIGFGRLEPAIATVYDPSSGGSSGTGSSRTTRSPPPSPERRCATLMSRLLGVRVGRKVFDDGCTLSERTLVEIGDGANLNEHSIIQSHSLEEGVFKSDMVRIGAGASVGVGALVHYGVTMGERTRLDADAFLMKGEITPAGSRWRGNPARLISSARAVAR